MGYLARALRLKKESLTTDSEKQMDDLPRTLLSEIKKPILIKSSILNDTLFLVANEAQAQEVEQRGEVAYLPGEIGTLLSNSKGMDEDTLKDYLSKIHATEKVFQGARIQ
jgi:hypothetical protein